jgi:hypothetical protein
MPSAFWTGPPRSAHRPRPPSHTCSPRACTRSQGYRTALGILRLAKTHGADRLEAACLRAMQIQAVTYRTIASLLKHRLERKAPTPTQATLPADHANVRGSEYYH